MALISGASGSAPLAAALWYPPAALGLHSSISRAPSLSRLAAHVGVRIYDVGVGLEVLQRAVTVRGPAAPPRPQRFEGQKSR
jgi:hypothetical protein